jgi:hypothetical protein
VTLSAMFPEPLAVQVPPPEPTQVHVAPVNTAGNVSVKGAAATGSGPPFEAVIVYVRGCPGTRDVTPLVLVMERSACGPPPAAAEAQKPPLRSYVAPV